MFSPASFVLRQRFMRARRSDESAVEPPINTVLPAITGTATVGQTLSVSNGTWTGDPTSYGYQWKADGVAIEGATASTYELTDEEIGAVITATVTATNAGGSTAATSEGTDEVEAALPEPHWNSVVLLTSFDGTDGATASVDDSPATRTLTFVGNAQLDTAQAKFGASSLLLDGNGDAVTMPNHADLLFGSDPFTVECFVRRNGAWSTEGLRYLVGVYDTNSQRSWALVARGAVAQIGLNYSTDGTTVLNSTHDWPGGPRFWSSLAGTYHVAMDRDASGVVRLYADGVMAGKQTITSTFFASSSPLSIGNSLASGVPTTFGWVGWIDELRITKGVARYASDSGFTVPTEAFPRS